MGAEVDHDFRFLASTMLDRVMPLPVVATGAGAVWLSAHRLTTAVIAAAFLASNLALNALLQRRERMPTWAPHLVGAGRLLVACVFVPGLILSAGRDAGLWFLAIPAISVVSFIFPAGRAWGPGGLICALTLAACWHCGYPRDQLVIAALSLASVGFIGARLVEALHQLVGRAKDAERTQGEFLATMSHEIRTPMNGVLSALTLLGEEEVTADQRDLVEVAQRSASGLLVILNDILDLSKLEAGKFTIDPTPFDPALFLRRLEQEFGARARAEGTTFEARLDGEPPASVLADGTRVSQILRNFLSNAFKFGKGTHVQLTLRCKPSARAGQNVLRFEVKDDGPGLAPQALGRLFEKFEQAEQGTARRYGGTGLGLAISRRLAELMGGRVGAVSKAGSGALFWFEATFARCDPAPDRAAPAPSVATYDARVLAVDDNHINRVVVRRLLEKLGCTVVLAEGGAEALDAVQRESFDLVLMDCQMPEIDGYEATRLIKALPRGRDLPVVALTASAMREEQARCKAAGMNGFLTKPIEIERLRLVLGQLGRPDDSDAGHRRTG